MQEKTMCSSNDKPGKYEQHFILPKQFNIKTCPDCDTKRTAVCKDPNCNNR